jgi:hypothetical protein
MENKYKYKDYSFYYDYLNSKTSLFESVILKSMIDNNQD